METPTHAGGIVFRETRGRMVYLIVASSNGAHWVLPKGHIRPGESAEGAALRELEEETGVLGEVIDRLSIQRFEKPEERVVVQYFLMRELDSGKAQEERSLRWEDEEAALRLLTFDDAREVLRRAAEVARQLRGR